MAKGKKRSSGRKGRGKKYDVTKVAVGAGAALAAGLWAIPQVMPETTNTRIGLQIVPALGGGFYLRKKQPKRRDFGTGLMLGGVGVAAYLAWTGKLMGFGIPALGGGEQPAQLPTTPGSVPRTPASRPRTQTSTGPAAAVARFNASTCNTIADGMYRFKRSTGADDATARRLATAERTSCLNLGGPRAWAGRQASGSLRQILMAGLGYSQADADAIVASTHAGIGGGTAGQTGTGGPGIHEVSVTDDVSMWP